MSARPGALSIVWALATLCLLASCKSDVRHSHDCGELSTDRERSVCEAFSGRIDEHVERDIEPSHVVLRSFCGGREHREAVSADAATDGVVRSVGRLFEDRTIDRDCTLAIEVLTPRMERTRWAAVEVFDQYAADRHGLVIHDEPIEVVTPLDFSTAPPKASLGTLERIPHLYARQARNRHYLDDDTLVQPVTVDGFVMRGEEPRPMRYHRVRQPDPDIEQLKSGVRRAALSLDEMRYEEAGRLYYEYDPYRDRFERHDYNLLRHAGTTWSIMQAYGLTGDRRFRRLGEYAFDWLLEQSETDERDGRTIRYAVESWNDKAKLGGAGLWLLALAEHARLTGEDRYRDVMQEIANHIYLSQDEKTGKFETFYERIGLTVTDHESDYYPGEAMFALHRAAPFVEDIPVCDVTERGLDYMLDDEPRRMPTTEYRFVNQWHAYAIREYRRDCDDKKFDWLWHREIDHMLETAATEEEAPVMAGAYIDSDGDVSTSPTRLEALTVICNELGAEDDDIARRCEPVIERVAAMQLTLQHAPHNAWLWPDPDATYGGFPSDIDDEAVRIDYTQHHLSAMYNAVEFFEDVVGDGEKERASTSEGDRSWPFNLIGDKTCEKLDEVDCL